MDPNYKPSERQKNCKYSFLYNGKKMNQTVCRKNLNELEAYDSEEYVSNEDCEA